MKARDWISALALITWTAGLVLVGACSPIEVDARDVEVTQHGVQFPAAPQAATNLVLALSQSFVLDTSSVILPKNVDARIDVDEVRLHAASGVSNLDFIRSASVAMANTAGMPVTVMAFTRAPGAPSGSDLEVTNTQPVDVSQAWSANQVRVDVSVSGTPPAVPWSIDLTVWLNAHVDYQF